MTTSAEPITLTDANFADEIESLDGLAIVDFWAEWCGPCRMIAPVVKEIASDYEGRVKVGKVDVDANGAISAKFGIRSIPSILYFKDGTVVDSVIGAVDKATLEAKIAQHA